ncbi:hypothetical protein [Paraclostridium bifermentans]|uniref:hypothetical protein n=1 Tax=Paraclostridium bifermentans TaxID=1490 RepID=UPI001898332E|nr:hypothetical protein [Paraclostridium bifermentans]
MNNLDLDLLLGFMKNIIVFTFLYYVLSKVKRYILIRKKLKFEEVEYGAKRFKKIEYLIADILITVSTVITCFISGVLIIKII